MKRTIDLKKETPDYSDEEDLKQSRQKEDFKYEREQIWMLSCPKQILQGIKREQMKTEIYWES